MSMKQGGLGIKNIRLANESLLLKWWWRYGQEHDALWKLVICEKYGSIGGRWFPVLATNESTSKIWEDILLMVQRKSRLFHFYKDNVEILIGNGDRVSFWSDPWMGSTNLLSQFPRLFQLVEDKELSLSLRIARKSNQTGWTFNFRRAFPVWKKLSWPD